MAWKHDLWEFLVSNQLGEIWSKSLCLWQIFTELFKIIIIYPELLKIIIINQIITYIVYIFTALNKYNILKKNWIYIWLKFFF